jgi:hypothetical protein
MSVRIADTLHWSRESGRFVISPRYAACGRKHEDIMAAAVPYEMSGV